MRKLETIVVPIQRDYDSCYALLAEPRNFPKWSPVLEGLFEPADDSGYAWLVDLPRGRRVMHFTRPNDHGILDYAIHSESGEHEYTARLRLIPNEEGSTLIAHYLHRPGTSEETFRSEVEWAANDLRSLALVVEAL